MKKFILTHWYAAHAPAVPDWFNVKLEPEPVNPGYLFNVFGKYSNHPLKETFIHFWDDEDECWTGNVPESLEVDVARHLFKLNLYLNQWQKWEEKKQVASIVQWRFFYAKIMIERGSGHV